MSASVFVPPRKSGSDARLPPHTSPTSREAFRSRVLGGFPKAIENTRAVSYSPYESDRSVLWRYTPHVPVGQLSAVVGDDLILIASQDGSIDALRASNGALRWHRAMNS